VKTAAIVVLLIVTVVVVGTAVLAPPTVEQASSALAKTERDLASSMTRSTTLAGALDHDLDTPELSRELAAFDQATARLARLVGELDREIIAYDNARTRKLAAFDQKLSAIKDPTTRRSTNPRQRTTTHHCTPILNATTFAADSTAVVVAVR
jgi:hypothetical protein